MTEQGCIKTGANVRLVPYDEVWHGDLYRVGDTYIFKQGGEPGARPAINLEMKDWYHIGISPQILAATPAMCGEFTYEGR